MINSPWVAPLNAIPSVWWVYYELILSLFNERMPLILHRRVTGADSRVHNGGKSITMAKLCQGLNRLILEDSGRCDRESPSVRDYSKGLATLSLVWGQGFGSRVPDWALV
jgi:hypothetical protein